MDLLYSINDIGFDADSPEELKEKLISYYTVEGISADVEIDGDFVHVHIDEQMIEKAQKDFEEITTLCSRGKFNEAKPKLIDFLERHPRHSEAYRIMAQMLMDAGKYQEAIDVNIDALRCDPRNVWALMLMGNIYGKYKNDLDTAKTYYDKILEYHPENSIAINNIAALLMEKNKFDEAIPIFKKVLDLSNTYANAYYGLAVCYFHKNEYRKCFDIALEGSRIAERTVENPNTLEELHKIMISSAKNIAETYNFENVFLGIKDEIESEYHTEIRVEEDNDLKVSATLEYGPSHHKRYHIIKYNSKMPFLHHLEVHELMHLQMSLEAARKDKNKIIFSTNDNEIAFRKKYNTWINQLIKRIGHSKAIEASRQIMSGLMIQAMNCPLDLFVEKRMYEKYPIMRPLQLLSLMNQEGLNIQSVKRGEKESLIPKSIVDASRIMNIVSSLHLEFLFGLRFYQEYKPTKAEFKIAQDLYDEFVAYEDYQPGEEYDLIEYFTESLHLDDYLSMGLESEYLRDSYTRQEETKIVRDHVIGEGESEGNSFDGLSEEQKKRQDAFYEENKDGENPMKTMMMSMYMQTALEYFENMPIHKIREIAFQIAMEGTKGIMPDKKEGYSVPGMPGLNLGGYAFLAFYYVSWALAEPDKLPALNLPFDEAYKLAQMMYNKKKNKDEDNKED